MISLDNLKLGAFLAGLITSAVATGNVILTNYYFGTSVLIITQGQVGFGIGQDKHNFLKGNAGHQGGTSHSSHRRYGQHSKRIRQHQRPRRGMHLRMNAGTDAGTDKGYKENRHQHRKISPQRVYPGRLNRYPAVGNRQHRRVDHYSDGYRHHRFNQDHRHRQNFYQPEIDHNHSRNFQRSTLRYHSKKYRRDRHDISHGGYKRRNYRGGGKRIRNRNCRRKNCNRVRNRSGKQPRSSHTKPCRGKACLNADRAKPPRLCKGRDCVSSHYPDPKPCRGKRCSANNDPGHQPCKGKHCVGSASTDPQPCRGKQCGGNAYPSVTNPASRIKPYRYSSRDRTSARPKNIPRHYLPPKRPGLSSTAAIPKRVQPPVRFMKKQVMIAMDMSSDMKKLNADLAAKGYKLKSSKKYLAIDIALNIYTVPDRTDVEQAVGSLRSRYPDFIIDANHLYDLHDGETGKQKQILQWGKVTKSCGKGLKIGLLDTDLQSNHTMFAGREITRKSFLPPGEKPAPKFHATAITSIWISEKTGLAPSAKVYVASVFRRENKKQINTSTEWLLSGLSWLAEQEVDVINLSFGGPANKVFEKAISNVQKKGMILVASAGNNGPAAPPVFPAAHKGVIAVTAVDNKLKLYNRANNGDYIDFAAPGVNILVAKPGNGKKIVSGTSYAAPYVAAAVAILKQSDKADFKTQIKHLKSTSKDLGQEGKDNKYGYGLIQLKNACVIASASKGSKSVAFASESKQVIQNYKSKILSSSQ